jgi:CRISPR-associated protein Csx17
MPELRLAGCTPEPLMSYLKALGVFRLVAEQADGAATLAWKDVVAHLTSQLDRDQLCAFFLEHYKPTPIVGPWGARSGFYPGNSESSAREALDSIVAGADQFPRLGKFRDAIVAVRALLDRRGFREKVRDDDKLALMRFCRNELPDDMIPWLDAVFILTDESRKFPPLLGTGGNEGSGSYVSTFAQVVASLLIDREADSAVATALYGDFAPALQELAVGHFNPGAIGGANSSQGFGGGGGVNAWDYLLAIEGSVLFAGAASRRMGTETSVRASYPFCVEAVAVGYASESETEAGSGTRAELWLPLWSVPVTIHELSQLLSEGRAQLGRRQARNAVEFALALATLGVSRGIEAFTRYAFVMRNGLSYFAAPLGHIAVTPRPAARLLDDPPLTEWVDRVRSACRDKDKTPARYKAALRAIDRATFGFASRSESGEAADRRELVAVLQALGRAERTLAGGLAFCKDKYIRPLQRLSPQWLTQADDGSPEFRLAAGLAGLRGSKQVGPLRVFLEEVEMKGAWANWSPGGMSAVWSTRPIADNLAAVFRRRQMEAFREGLTGVPLDSVRPTRLEDVVAFLTDPEFDNNKLHDLTWGLIGIDWSEVEAQPPEPPSGDRYLEVPFEFGLPRLVAQPRLYSPFNGFWQSTRSGSANAVADPEVFNSLVSGRANAVTDCVDRAARRLKSGGLLAVGYQNRRRAGTSLAVQSPFPPTRLLGAMLFPLAEAEFDKLANAVLNYPEAAE